MTHAIDSMLVERELPVRGELPHVPSWVVPRAHLADRLDLGVLGPLTLVTGPSGWGKTLGVASWAASPHAPDGLIWLSLAGVTGDPDLFWELLHDAIVEAGGRSLAPVPPMGSHDSRRRHALALFGTWLHRNGPRLLVLDDYPTGDVGALGRDLEIVLDHARRGLSLVVISHGQPALAVQRHHVAGDLTRITVPDLAMDWHEVAGVLARHDVDARALTARTVERHTAGWACGVRLAALALRDAPTIGAAMDEADRATVDFLASEVLAKTSPRVRELLVRTSMVADVGQDLARAVMGPKADVVITPGIAGDGFVELRGDGSFCCHPLLRAAAVAELARQPREVGQEAVRRAAQWYVDDDQTTAGLEIAMAGQDWTWVARTLVESYAVPAVLAGAGTEIVESALAVPAVAAAEPLLEAAVLVNRGGPEAAEAVLALIAGPGTADEKAVPDELSEIFVRLAVARARGDADTGLLLATGAKELMAHLRIERQRELLTMLEAHVGALELCSGELERAEITLRHAVLGATDGNQPSAAQLDCLGQLALLEGFRGNLRQAERQAAPVLSSSTSSETRAGVAHAHLALAWVHLERAEHVPARQHLDRAAAVRGDGAEPWYTTAQLLAEASLFVSIDQPEVALRLLAPAMDAGPLAGEQSAWMQGQVSVAATSALAATGEPERALEVLARDPGIPRVDGALLAARVRVGLGDVAGARAALQPVAADLPRTPLATQIGCWLLMARLAHEDGESGRARVLVDRALREAAREMMRRPVTHETAWLFPLVDDDPTLRRAHGGYLAGLRSSSLGHSPRRPEPGSPAPMVVETLTVREAQVLALLAEMCSTEEIANELFLSVNTVKTYVRGILRKLYVNRRVDAVRRGRELGLC